MPTRLRRFHRRICTVPSAADHSALLTAQGEVYTFGLGQYGVLGHGVSRAMQTHIAHPVQAQGTVGSGCLLFLY